jgi:zinc D-Ala-D-Ala carboxypeptidase
VPRTRRPVGAAIITIVGVLLGAAPAAAAEPLPACHYDDVRTRYDDEREWRKTLLDTIYKVPRSYAPSRLVSTAQAGLNGGHYVRPALIEPLRAMARAARAADAAVAVTSAYRSYARQEVVFQQEVERYGYEQALLVSARPGHSEHQLGTTIDFRSAHSSRLPWDYDDWGATRPGRWMKRHAWEYGFVMSYPKGKRSTTCYSYEPWHYRFVGKEAAAEIHSRDITLRRYLWTTYETAP